MSGIGAIIIILQIGLLLGHVAKPGGVIPNVMGLRLETVSGLPTFISCLLDLSDVPVIDGTAALAIDDMLRIVRAHKQHLFFVGMQPHVTEALERFGVLGHIRPGHRYAERLDPLRPAAEAAGSTHPEDISLSPDEK